MAGFKHCQLQITSLVINLDCSELEQGDRKRAMSRLRVPPFESKKTDWTTMLVGFSAGCFMVLLMIIIASSIIMNTSRKIPQTSEEQHEAVSAESRHLYRSDWTVVTRLYRGPMLCIIMIFLLGINVRGWGAAGVNHKLIFELDPRHHSSHHDILGTAIILAVMWCISLVIFIFADYLSIPAFYSPLALIITYAVFLFNPVKVLKYEARSWMLNILARMILAPLPFVVFADFWVADQFNSIAPALKDLHYFVCFYTNNETTLDNGWDVAVDSGTCSESWRWLPYVLVSIPAYWRWSQCLRRYRDTRAAFPHLVNAGKYSSGIITNIIR